MQTLVHIEVHPGLYLRDPLETELGRKIVAQSIPLMDRLGFESFTFRKLAVEIESTEASVYRYYKSKHQLLNYLLAWYWGWIEYTIRFKVNNITDARRKLRTALEVLARARQDDPRTTIVDEGCLHRIVVSESAKAHLARKLKRDSKEGVLVGYASLCGYMAGIFNEISPRYKFPRALATSVIAALHKNALYAENFPAATELKIKDDDTREIVSFAEELVMAALS